MANRTDKSAMTRHGKDPQGLVEKIVRDKVYYTHYWKTECFALNAESLIDKAVKLLAVGGTYGGNRRPSEFLCLTLKLLQIQPVKEIIVEFISNENHKYLRVLGAFYMRLTGSTLDCYQYLEPLLQDYRKIRYIDEMGNYSIKHIDEIINLFLTKTHSFNISLPFLTPRSALEDSGQIKPRESVLAELDDLEAEEPEEIPETTKKLHQNNPQNNTKNNTKNPQNIGKQLRYEKAKGEKISKNRNEGKKKRYTKIFSKRPMDVEDSGDEGGAKEVMSVDATNSLRAKLGLKPLV